MKRKWCMLTLMLVGAVALGTGGNASQGTPGSTESNVALVKNYELLPLEAKMAIMGVNPCTACELGFVNVSDIMGESDGGECDHGPNGDCPSPMPHPSDPGGLPSYCTDLPGGGRPSHPNCKCFDCGTSPDCEPEILFLKAWCGKEDPENPSCDDDCNIELEDLGEDDDDWIWCKIARPKTVLGSADCSTSSSSGPTKYKACGYGEGGDGLGTYVAFETSDCTDGDGDYRPGPTPRKSKCRKYLSCTSNNGSTDPPENFDPELGW